MPKSKINKQNVRKCGFFVSTDLQQTCTTKIEEFSTTDWSLKNYFDQSTDGRSINKSPKKRLRLVCEKI